MRRIGFPIPIALLFAFILVATVVAAKPQPTIPGGAVDSDDTVTFFADMNPEHGQKLISEAVWAYLENNAAHSMSDFDGDGVFEGIAFDPDDQTSYVRIVYWDHGYQDAGTFTVQGR